MAASSAPSFALTPPIEPVLAKLADALPAAPGFVYEPKWDGFRAIVFRQSTDVYIQSRDLKPLDRYFPELRDALVLALDGEDVRSQPQTERRRRLEGLLQGVQPPAAVRRQLATDLAPLRIAALDGHPWRDSWERRPDRSPSYCRYDQLEVTAPFALDAVFGRRSR